MVALNQNYNVNELPEQESFTPLPSGTYPALVVASQMKPTKSGNGNYLELEIDITSGDFKGRKLFERLNLDNPNEAAVEIAFKVLGSLCRAVGLDQIGDSNQLHNLPFMIDVDIEEGKPYTKDGVEKMGSAQNRIKKYHPFANNSPAPAATTQAETAAPAASTGGAPWEK